MDKPGQIDSSQSNNTKNPNDNSSAIPSPSSSKEKFEPQKGGLISKLVAGIFKSDAGTNIISKLRNSSNSNSPLSSDEDIYEDGCFPKIEQIPRLLGSNKGSRIQSRTASFGNLQRTGTETPPKPLKPALKKPASFVNGSVEKVPTGTPPNETQGEVIAAEATTNVIAPTEIKSMPAKNSVYSPSAPDLNVMFSHVETIKKSASSKTLAFNLENTPVVPTYSSKSYNRKPDSNLTYKKLNPKLKNEIRNELNDFKRNEMSVHELSTSNTAFH
jgi:hypothetical protein